MNTWQIKIGGIVQGVGFRPLVYKRAIENEILGEVSNGNNGVKICFNANKENALKFYQDILSNKPQIAKITHSSLTKREYRFFEKFQIIESENAGEKNLFFTPDYALCEDCKRELNDISDRRHHYPFITCTNCGPRYSIIENLPYDRPLTTMDEFSMCQHCYEEYHNPLDRRHFSQTNSCKNCGIKMFWQSKLGNDKSEVIQEEILNNVLSAWKKGEIVAIKGIGGFLLTCDANNSSAVEKLRERKFRPSKPFALMYPSIEYLSDFFLSEIQIEELKNECSPILLLRNKKDQLFLSQIAEGLDELGVMIPYAPLFEWLLKKFDAPIVATSANFSNSPIIFEENKEDELFQIANHILCHNRKILIPQDDSVVRYSKFYQQRVLIRRSRGFAPTYFTVNTKFPDDKCILAFGADIKSAFTILYKGNVYISQYLGDLGHFDTQGVFQKVLDHIKNILRANPEVILCDKHPGYSSTHLANKLANSLEKDCHHFQHHKAHFAAVLAENDLLFSKKILGVIWDGTGLGDDDHIWGGEFFLFEQKTINRITHLSPFPLIGGDKLAKEPRLSAFSLQSHEPIVRNKFTEPELRIYDQIVNKNHIKTSSMGRLFDAVASILNISDFQTYEGEAAMKLEVMARNFFGESLDFKDHYKIKFNKEGLDATKLINNISTELKSGKARGYIAAKFHYTLVQIINNTANHYNTKKIAFSGGVFQNTLLIDLIIHHLGKNFDLYFHQQLSPNDENISFGQLVLYLLKTNNL